jgi:hypothetical protein
MRYMPRGAIRVKLQDIRGSSVEFLSARIIVMEDLLIRDTNLRKAIEDAKNKKSPLRFGGSRKERRARTREDSQMTVAPCSLGRIFTMTCLADLNIPWCLPTLNPFSPRPLMLM